MTKDQRSVSGLEKFKANELTITQYSQVIGARSKTVETLNEGGPGSAEITTIDRNNGTVVVKIRYFEN